MANKYEKQKHTSQNKYESITHVTLILYFSFRTFNSTFSQKKKTIQLEFNLGSFASKQRWRNKLKIYKINTIIIYSET